MNTTTESIRPTKKQRILLAFIEQFINEHGYSPSYREIMVGLGYTSVATVALHVNSLISRGQLTKRDYSARSLEVVNDGATRRLTSNAIKPAEEKWLVDKVEHFIRRLEAERFSQPNQLEEVTVLINALKILGLDGAAQSFLPRLAALEKGIE